MTERTKRTLVTAAGLAAAWLLLGAAEAAACPVCYGEAGGDMIDGAKLSILFLGGLVYTVIGGAAGVVLALRRRVRKNLDRRHGLHLVSPPGSSRT